MRIFASFKSGIVFVLWSYILLWIKNPEKNPIYAFVFVCLVLLEVESKPIFTSPHCQLNSEIICDASRNQLKCPFFYFHLTMRIQLNQVDHIIIQWKSISFFLKSYITWIRVNQTENSIENFTIAPNMCSAFRFAHKLHKLRMPSNFNTPIYLFVSR